MSGRGGGGGNNGVSGIPAASRKMVQSLKEIVDNCTEQEIYATLKECNMDPNEAVNRLLSQVDPFHEVKSKREKKKENKDITETRSRGLGSNSNRGNRGSTDRYAGRGGSNQFSTTASGVFNGKLPSRKENGNHSSAGSSSSAPFAGGNNMNWQPLPCSNVVLTENKISTVGAVDGISSSQPSTGQSDWSGAKGQVSMADIVKMGRPQGNASAMQNAPVHSVNHSNNVLPGSVSSRENLHSSQNQHAHKVTEMHTEPGLSYQQISPDDEWPSFKPLPTTSISTVEESSMGSESEPSNIPKNGMHQKINSGVDVTHVVEDGSVETINGKHVRPVSDSGRNWQDDDSRGASAIDTNLYKETSTYEQHVQTFEQNEAEDGVTSVSENLDQLRLQEDDEGIPTEDETPSVVIPDHLQIHTPDCFHLSFGSFGSFGSGTRPLTSNIDETSMPADVSSAVHSETGNPEYYPEEHLRPSSDGNLIQRGGPSDENYDTPSISQSEVLRQETPEIAPSNDYAFPSSAPDYTYESNHQSSIAYGQQQTRSQIQNLGPFASITANSLPSTLLASTVQTAREDPSYAPFLVTQSMPQSMPTKYSNIASSITSPTISMSEALRSGNISNMSQHAPQALPGANVPTAPTLPQHLNVHQYSQPNLPLSHFTNMISYPLLPQSYAYMPSTFPQAYAGNSTAYHQSLAAMLPQYKNNVSVSSLPQSTAIPSGYGFGSSTSIPGGNFPLNLPAAAMGTNVGYDDVMSSQFKDNSHLISLQQQQNDNSAMWVQQGPGSRTMSPGSNYYSFQGQSQPANALRQSQQQPSQHHFGGALGYPNYYHSQTGISLEHQQQQNLRDASLGGGSQGSQPPPKPTQQIWQNDY